ncbi:hypothetical protein J3R83DRAFT_9236 [Lanmaoa asiatica]|nr:hypothetical protein J3R83DRAFT_9236 [Lanmaoa asiatica]
MASDNPWVTITLTVSLQAFYVVGPSLYLFHPKVLTLTLNSAVYCWAGVHYTATSHINYYCTKPLSEQQSMILLEHGLVLGLLFMHFGNKPK